MEKKILYTTSIEDIIESMSEILECKKHLIKCYISTRQIDYDNVSLVEFFNYINFQYNDKKERQSKMRFDKLIISHLTSGLTEPNGKNFVNLYDLLLQDNEITTFLQGHGLVFKSFGNRIIPFYKGNSIKIDRGKLLYNRLKKSGNILDNSINGFLFNHEIYEDSNVRHIKYIPEFMSCLCDTINDGTIELDWKRKSKSYTVGLIAKIEDITYDNYRNYKTVISKTYLTYKFLLIYLSQNQFGKWNPVIDNKIVCYKNNESFEKNEIFGYYENP